MSGVTVPSQRHGSLMTSKIPISILDFCPVLTGETPREALLQATDLAARVEKLGYKRFWVAEHHGAPTVASSATSVVISHIASNTKTIRVGAGGVMLPNHAPLVVAEQFGTLASLYPDRIDLGLGRAVGGAPGKEEIMARALRLAPDARARYPSDVRELEAYRSNFRPSDALDRPYAMICVIVIAADSDETAEYLLTSLKLTMLERLRGQPGPLQRPVRSLEAVSTPEERRALERFIPLAVVGAREKVFNKLDALISVTEADELIVLTLMHDQAARHRSFELLAKHKAFALV